MGGGVEEGSNGDANLTVPVSTGERFMKSRHSWTKGPGLRAPVTASAGAAEAASAESQGGS